MAPTIRCLLKFERNDVIGSVEKKCSQAKTGSNLSNVDPQFTLGPRGHYYHLSAGSPLVDAGSNRFANEAGLQRDLGRRHRIIDGGHDRKVDIGAFEYPPGELSYWGEHHGRVPAKEPGNKAGNELRVTGVWSSVHAAFGPKFDPGSAQWRAAEFPSLGRRSLRAF